MGLSFKVLSTKLAVNYGLISSIRSYFSEFSHKYLYFELKILCSDEPVN